MKNSGSLSTRLSSLALYLGLLLVLALVLPWLVGMGQSSDDIVVNDFGDVKKGNDGLCTLREAVIAANSDKQSGGKPGECPAGSGADTIVLGAGTYMLSRTDNGNEDSSSTGDLDIYSGVTIVGAGAGKTIIDASGITDRAFHVLSGNVEISDVTITKSDTFAGEGAAIYNSGDLTLRNSAIEGANATLAGGGIYNAGLLALHNSTISGNTAGDGGGIANASGGSVALNNSTVSGNTAGTGGGIYNMGLLALHNATIAANIAGTGGGVLNTGDSGTANLWNTIIAGNSATTGPDCSGSLTSWPETMPEPDEMGYNLVQDTSGCTILLGVVESQDPLLGPLEDNGGTTETHLLLPGSPAIDAGDPAGCFGSEGLLSQDQRGEPRPMDGDHDRDFRCDMGAVEVGGTILVLTKAFEDGTMEGRLGSAANTAFDLAFFATDECPTGFGPVPGAIDLGSTQVETDDFGNAFFTAAVAPPGKPFVYGTATTAGDSTPEVSQCVPVGPGNDSWPDALLMPLSGDPPSSVVDDHYIAKLGQSRWYKFPVEPNSRVIVTLTGPLDEGGNPMPLPANYDLALYKDIRAAFFKLNTPQDQEDLALLGAEFAADAFSADAFSADAFSADAFSADAFSADAFSADAFSADAFSADAFSADAFSADAFSADAFSADAFSADAFSADAFSADAFSADAFSADAFSADAFSADAFSADAFSADAFSAVFSNAQLRSLLGVSAFEGTAFEGLTVNTWSETGEFYVRVRGRNGVFSLDAPFRLAAAVIPGSCGSIEPLPETPALSPLDVNPKTLILVDQSRMDRMGGTAEEKATLLALLDTLAGRPEVDGLVVDVAEDPRVTFANGQADANPACPYAKNLVAQAIKEIVDGYRTQPGSNLEYIVLVGGDEIIPFARYPDDALLANEKNYFPPVLPDSASQASLRLGYVLSQDVYGSKVDVSLDNSTFPIPGQAVGRLVETAGDINAVLSAYLGDDDGVLGPSTALSTGYDFLADAATEVANQFALGGVPFVDTSLIDERGVAPENGWTADQLREGFLEVDRVDLAFLAGHFTANSWLAADYSTRLLTADLIESDVDLANSVILGAGCHAGYNIVNQHGVPHVTREPDWAQAFARKGATLVAGTGYQYGDTDLLKYSELLYLESVKQLRLVSDDPISIGQALVEAKKAYLLQTPQISGLDEKALLEAAIFGLPMLRVDLNRGYQPPAASRPAGLAPQQFPGNTPGGILGLWYDDITVTSPLNEELVVLTNVDDTSAVTDVPASYLSGTEFGDNAGVVTYPAEPILPLEVRDVSASGLAGNLTLRGMGFRGGSYQQKDVFPLIGTPTTEVRGVHAPFLADYPYPVQTWHVNHLAALATGKTLVFVTPAQHWTSLSVSDPQESTRRQFGDMDFRLYYSNNVEDYGTEGHSIPGLSAPPTIMNVSAVLSDDGKVVFGANVVGNPTAGIQEVWVTYTDAGVSCPVGGGIDCAWQALDLEQDPGDSTLWTGELDLVGAAIDPLDLRYFPQAVNGVGLVSRADNLGAFFKIQVDPGDLAETQLEFQSPLAEGYYGTKATFRAMLTSDGIGLGGQILTFRLGSQMRRAETAADGSAEANLSLIGAPGSTAVRVSFAGTDEYQPSAATSPFEILQRPTELCLRSPSAGDEICDGNPTLEGRAIDDPLLVAALRTDPATGEPLSLFEKTVIFEISGPGGDYSEAVVTDFAGRAFLGNVPLPRGTYDLTVSFAGTVNYEATVASGTLILHNSPPVLEEDLYTLDKYELVVDAPGVLANDSDTDGDPIAASLVISPTLGTVALNPDGSLTYRPDASFDSIDASDTFVYTGHDGFDFSDEPTMVTIVPSICFTAEAVLPDGAPSIWPPNGEPISVTVELGSEDLVLITGILQDEPVVSAGGDGQFIDGDIDTVVVLADRDGTGNGRVYHLPFTAFDDQGSSLCDGEVRVPVVPHDQSGTIDEVDEGGLYDSTESLKFAPVANDDSASTDEDTAIVDGNVLANDTDQNPHDVLTVVAVNGDGAAVGSEITLPTGALLTVNADGSFQYDPSGHFDYLADGEPVDDAFDYTVSDGSATDTAVVTISIAGVNDAPYALDDQATTPMDTAVTIDLLENDGDVDGSLVVISVHLVQEPDNGMASVDQINGTVTYTPTPGFSGVDFFRYTVNDDHGLSSNEATVTIKITAPPVAVDDTALTDEDVVVIIDVLANDTDDSAIDPGTVAVTNQPGNGTASVDPDDGRVTYTPDADYYGEDAFTYTVDDDDGLTSDVATVTITVMPINDPPVAKDDSVATPENTAVGIDVLGNDSDVDGDSLSVISFDDTSTGGGSVDCSDGQQCTYTPPTDFSGTDGFTYTVSDSNGDTDTAMVTITVGATNDPPVAMDDPDVTAVQGTPVTINVLANDTDPNGDPLTVIEIGEPARGTVQPNADGTLTYVPNSSFKGTDTFVYTISDGRGGTDSATVTVTFVKK